MGYSVVEEMHILCTEFLGGMCVDGRRHLSDAAFVRIDQPLPPYNYSLCVSYDLGSMEDSLRRGLNPM